MGSFDGFFRSLFKATSSDVSMLFFEYPPLNVFSKTSAPFSIVPAVISTPVFIPLAATLVTVFVVSPTAIPKNLAIAPIIGPNVFEKN